MFLKTPGIIIGICLALIENAAGQSRTLRLGIVTDLSGAGSYIGNQTRRGADLAREDLRNEGIPVELLYEDHQSSSAKAASAAQKLTSIENVHAIYTNFSGPAAAISPIASRSSTILVYSAAALSPMKDNPFAFKTYIDYRDGCRDVAEVFAQRSVPLCLLKAESEFAALCEESLLKKNPALAVEAYRSGETVDTQVLKLEAKGCKAIINPSYEGDIRNMLSAILRLRLPMFVAFTNDSLTSTIQRQYRAILARSVTFGLPEPDEAFVSRLKNSAPAFDTSSVEFAAIAYLHVLQLGRSSKSCQDLRAGCLRESLLQAKSDPRFGFLGWDEERVARFSSGLKDIAAVGSGET